MGDVQAPFEKSLGAASAIKQWAGNHPNAAQKIKNLIKHIRSSDDSEGPADAIQEWLGSHPGVRAAIREASLADVVSAIQDADLDDVQAAADRFPGAASAIKQWQATIQMLPRKSRT